MSKFERKSKQKIAQIPGTKPALKNSVLLVSTGIPSLDSVLGGGLPLGSLMVLEEDKYGAYSEIVAQCFTSAGVVSSNFVHFCSLDTPADNFLETLPSECSLQASTKSLSSSTEQMKIAWKYTNIKPLDNIDHRFDFSKSLALDNMSNKVSKWEVGKEDIYEDFLRSVQMKLTELKLKTGIPNQSMNLLRIPILSMGSSLWSNEGEEHNPMSITRCLTGLRAILRRSFAVALVTVPHSITKDPLLRSRIRSIADISIGLESFEGADKEINSSFKGYDGLFFINKIAPLNFYIPLTQITKDWVYKFYKKKFSIEKFHLPPLLSETASRTSENKPKAPCSLDF